MRRRPLQPQQSASRRKRLVLLTLTMLVGIGALVVIALWPQQSIDCITSEHTYCPKPIEELLLRNQDKPWWQTARAQKMWESQARELDPTVVSLQARTAFPGFTKVTLTLAQKRFSATIGDTTYTIRDGGLVTPDGQASDLPHVELPATLLTENRLNLREKERETFFQLMEKLEGFSPQIKSIVWVDDTELRATPVDYGPIVMRVNNPEFLDHQLNALQSFFRSPTIDKNYTELDVRFQDVVVR